MKKIKMTGQLNNAGSTMVEVIVGFVILVMVLAECMVHLLGVSGELVKKSKDMQEDQRVLNEEMYQKDADFEKLTDAQLTLTVDTEKTDTMNTPQPASVSLNADLYRYYSDRADLAVFRVIHRREASE